MVAVFVLAPKEHGALECDEAANEGGLLVRVVERSASKTVDRDVVNLPVLGLHQQRPAVTTEKIDGVVAGVEDRRDFEHATRERRCNDLKAGTSMGFTAASPAYRRERYSVSRSTGALNLGLLPVRWFHCALPYTGRPAVSTQKGETAPIRAASWQCP